MYTFYNITRKGGNYDALLLDPSCQSFWALITHNAPSCQISAKSLETIRGCIVSHDLTILDTALPRAPLHYKRVSSS